MLSNNWTPRRHVIFSFFESLNVFSNLSQYASQLCLVHPRAQSSLFRIRLTHLTFAAKVMSFGADEVVLRQGEPPHHASLILVTSLLWFLMFVRREVERDLLCCGRQVRGSARDRRQGDGIRDPRRLACSDSILNSWSLVLGRRVGFAEEGQSETLGYHLPADGRKLWRSLPLPVTRVPRRPGLPVSIWLRVFVCGQR